MAKSLRYILSPEFIVRSVRKRGLFYSFHAGLKVVNVRIRHRFFSTRLGRAFDVLLNVKANRKPLLYAFYDLSKAANGFDILVFMVLAERERRKQGYHALRIVIVPPDERRQEIYRTSYKVLGATDFFARLQSILIPSLYLLPSCEGFTICTSRNEASRVFDMAGLNVFPEKYTVRAPIASVKTRYIREIVAQDGRMPSLKAPEIMRNAAKQWLSSKVSNKKVVVITLREASYGKDRNSDIDSWAKFARFLADGNDYFPVFIRDTEKIGNPIPSQLKYFTVCQEASVNLLFRTGIYEEAYLNLFVSNGPASLCLFNEVTRYLMFKMITSTNSKATREFLEKSQGMVFNEPFPGATAFQKLVWEDDTYEVIKREFENMCTLIENSKT